MKFSCQKPGTKASDDNLVPLINVVFLMLIFFMVAGQIRATDKVAISPPESLSKVMQEQAPAMILLSTQEGLFLNGQTLALTGLTQALQALYAKASDADAFSVQISVDANYPLAQLQPVFQAVKRAGLTRVYLVTRLKKVS